MNEILKFKDPKKLEETLYTWRSIYLQWYALLCFCLQLLNTNEMEEEFAKKGSWYKAAVFGAVLSLCLMKMIYNSRHLSPT